MRLWRQAPPYDYEETPTLAAMKSCQPDKAAIRKAVGDLGESVAFRTLLSDNHIKKRFYAIQDVMSWIWEDEERPISFKNVAWLIIEANKHPQLLPIYILVREHSSTLHFSDGVSGDQRKLLTYLLDLPSSRRTGRERRALRLLEWFNEDPSRWHTFFTLPDRSLRQGEGGEKSWEWWFKEPREGEYRDKRALDEWEREMMRREDWRK